MTSLTHWNLRSTVMKVPDVIENGPPGREMSHRRTVIAVAAGVVLAAGGAVAVVGVPGGGPSRPSATVTPRPSSHQSSLSAAPIDGLSRLPCDQGTTAITPAPAGDPRAGGLASGGWQGTGDPSVRNSGVAFQKAFLYVTADAAPWTRVSVVSPDSARLYYVRDSDWPRTAGAQLPFFDLDRGTRSVSFQFCGEQPQGYFGGIMTHWPACVVLAVEPESSGAVPSCVTVPIGAACDARGSA